MSTVSLYNGNLNIFEIVIFLDGLLQNPLHDIKDCCLLQESSRRNLAEIGRIEKRFFW